jgi:hypothetical protein
MIVDGVVGQLTADGLVVVTERAGVCEVWAEGFEHSFGALLIEVGTVFGMGKDLGQRFKLLMRNHSPLSLAFIVARKVTRTETVVVASSLSRFSGALQTPPKFAGQFGEDHFGPKERLGKVGGI